MSSYDFKHWSGLDRIQNIEKDVDALKQSGGGGSSPDGTTIDLNVSSELEVKDAGVSEAKLGLSDVTTSNSSTSKHGLLPKLDGTSTHFLNGSGAWATPAGSSTPGLSSVLGVSADAGGVAITDLLDPSLAQDAATKNYVDLNAVSGSGAFIPHSLAFYVDYANGSDSNNGLAPATAYKTIQGAYNALKTYALANYSASGVLLSVGRLILTGGADHDVGTGLVIDYRYPVEILGSAAGSSLNPQGTASRIISSSATATEMVLNGSLGSATISYGFLISGVTFVYQPSVNTAMTALIRLNKTRGPRVENCFGYSSSDLVTYDGTNHDVPLIEHNGGSSGTTEGAFFRFVGCATDGIPLYHGLGGNLNRGLIGWCDCEFGSGASYPMVWIDGLWFSSVLAFCEFEGGASGPHVTVGNATSNVKGCMFISNGGEASTHTFPFYNVVNASWCDFQGGICTSDTTFDWITFSANSYPNKVRNGNLTPGGSTGYKNSFTRNSTYPALSVIEGKDGIIYYQKSGTAPTFSASDFPATPPDGTICGFTHNTTSGENRMWTVMNGAYVSAVYA